MLLMSAGEGHQHLGVRGLLHGPGASSWGGGGGQGDGPNGRVSLSEPEPESVSWRWTGTSEPLLCSLRKNPEPSCPCRRAGPSGGPSSSDLRPPHTAGPQRSEVSEPAERQHNWFRSAPPPQGGAMPPSCLEVLQKCLSQSCRSAV